MKLLTNTILALGLVALGAGLYFAYDTGMFMRFTNQQEPSGVDAPREEEGGVVCIQVITPARNPETNEIREFPTPCDVPSGWEVIENDIPDLELEVM